MRLRSNVAVLFGVLAPLTVGCGGASPAAAPSGGAKASSGAAAERFFPLEEGRLYHYLTRENGETGMLVARVHRSDATHGELRLTNTTKRFVYGPSSVSYDGGATILKDPIEVGASWPGEHGGTTKVSAVDTNVTVAAGSYSGCVQTVEEGGRMPGARYATTYCPGVGMVLLEISAAGNEARAELKSYGAPVKIE
ncbi:hypothetical protein AKJ09_02061 [Labilithrix luteola]|uniref:Lipoprotein n=1 Tax=Labilithrix luteola TaxID=1391654 RepID=A0A0K1PPF8_9BACT|nr:hypothetical protein [Labilithrix luteola]AKU95397.1 hypothetical protein AKJ09_02061 [Labilithrix luteola]